MDSQNQPNGGSNDPADLAIPINRIADELATSRQSGTSLKRSQIDATPDLVLWYLIKRSSEKLSFENYKAFTDFVLCGTPLPEKLQSDKEKLVGDDENKYPFITKKRFLPYIDADAYRLLKAATETFVMVNCAVKIENIGGDDVDVLDKLLTQADISGNADTLINTDFLEQYLDKLTLPDGSHPRILPYISTILQKLPELKDKIKKTIFKEVATATELDKYAGDCYGLLQEKLTNPCMLELIWSYWLEQGMLVQTQNAISRRFQNIRGPVERDPLAMMEFDSLRPLNNLLWGYVQDEQHRLTVVRRAIEYDHHYGLTLEGKAIPEFRTADSRSRFLESFHNLLYLVSVFFKQDDDTTVKADAFPVLNALKDVHMLLSEGAHNQYGDLPSTARVEMLMQQWLLARPEFREVLPSRVMVAYPEPWMERVDAMKRLQGWNETSVMHFHKLAMYGEQLLLSIRFGNWGKVDDEANAANWVRFWRSQIQAYIHAYNTVTGVNLTAEVTQPQQRELRLAQPSTLLRQRLTVDQAMPMLPSAPQGFRQRQAARRLPGD